MYWRKEIFGLGFMLVFKQVSGVLSHINICESCPKLLTAAWAQMRGFSTLLSSLSPVSRSCLWLFAVVPVLREALHWSLTLLVTLLWLRHTGSIPQGLTGQSLHQASVSHPAEPIPFVRGAALHKGELSCHLLPPCPATPGPSSAKPARIPKPAPQSAHPAWIPAAELREGAMVCTLLPGDARNLHRVNLSQTSQLITPDHSVPFSRSCHLLDPCSKSTHSLSWTDSTLSLNSTTFENLCLVCCWVFCFFVFNLYARGSHTK